MSNDIVARALEVLAANPTSADIDFLVTAHASVGYLAASAENKAEEAEALRKYEENRAYVAQKQGAEKVTDAQARAMAEVASWPLRQAEVKAYGRAKMLKNLLASITEAINAIKYIGRYDSPNVRLPK